MNDPETKQHASPTSPIVCSYRGCTMRFHDVAGRGERRGLCLDHADDVFGPRPDPAICGSPAAPEAPAMRAPEQEQR